MTRREALRSCIILSLSAGLIPSCKPEHKPTVPLKHLDLSYDQENVIFELAETIIPRTDTPGAKDTATHLFVLKMLDDMYTMDQQQQYVKGLDAFEKLAKKQFDKGFVDLTTDQRTKFIKAIGEGKSSDKDIDNFWSTTKRLTVQGYVSSKYYLSNVQIYKLVPGKFKGCITVAATKEKGISI